jgi:hypothetical protein
MKETGHLYTTTARHLSPFVAVRQCQRKCSHAMRSAANICFLGRAPRDRYTARARQEVKIRHIIVLATLTQSALTVYRPPIRDLATFTNKNKECSYKMKS